LTKNDRDGVMARINANPAQESSASSALMWQRQASALGNDARLLMMAETVGHMGYWHWNVLTGRLDWSDQVFQIYGVDPISFPLTFAAAMDACHPEDRERVLAAFNNAVTQREAFEFDCRIQRRDGIRSIICKGQPEYGGTGVVVALYGVLADVTDAFAAIRALHDQKEMLGLAAHLAHLGHWIWSGDEDCLAFCSDELARIHDLSPTAFISQYRHPLLLADAVVAEGRTLYRDTVEAALGSPRGYEIEYQIETGAGALKHIREIGQPILDDHGRLRRFIATVQDISEAKQRENKLARAEEELKRKTIELQDSNVQKDRLFSIVAHDLRSPFNTVMGFADVLAEKAGCLPPDKVASYAHIVRSSAADMQTLLNSLLTWASVQMRGGSLRLATLGLGSLVVCSLEPLRRMAEEKGVSVVNGVAGVTVRGDQDLICIVLRNLLSNGIKFSRRGGVVQITACADTEAHSPMVKVTVRDEGVGMSPSIASEVFGPLCVNSAIGTWGEKGTGLGLHLCRDIIRQHGGVVTLDSTPESGTSVHFTLPAAV